MGRKMDDDLPYKAATDDWVSDKELETWRPWVVQEGDRIRPYRDLKGFMSACKNMSPEIYKRNRELRRRFLRCLRDPEYHVLERREQCALFDIDNRTLKNWEMQVPDDYLAEALTEQRRRHAMKTMKVDNALFKAASDPDKDAKHKELWYRIHGWVPSQGVEVKRGRDVSEMSNAELVGMMVKEMSAEEKRRVMEECNATTDDGPIDVGGEE